MIIAPAPLVDWTSFLMEGFYTMGFAEAGREFIPQLRAKDRIIDEKDELVLSYVRHTEDLSDVIREQGTTIAAQAFRIDEQELEIAKWKRRFWYAAGAAVVGTGLFAIAIAAF